MAINKEKKKNIIDRLTDIAKNAKTIVFVTFSGLSAEEANEIRSSFENEGVHYFVAKKTLIKKVFNDASIEGDIPELKGEVAVAYGEDILAPAQNIARENKRLSGKVDIIGGVYEGKFVEEEKMKSIGNIPTLDLLRTQFVTMLNSPIQSLVSVLSQASQK